MKNGEYVSENETRAEVLLKDAAVQAGMRNVFSELDNFEASVNEKTEYKLKKIGGSSLTADGDFIEAYQIALPMPANPEVRDYNSPEYEEYLSAIDASHKSKEYVIFAFNVEDLKSPDFQLKPLEIDKQGITEYRGSGIDIKLPADDDPEPTFDKERTKYGGPKNEEDREEFEQYVNLHQDWVRRNTLHLPQMPNDKITYRGNATETFRTVRERAGVPSLTN